MNLLQKADELAAQTTDALRNAKLVIGLSEISRWNQHMVLSQRRYLLSVDTYGNELYFVHTLDRQQLCSHDCAAAFCHLPDCASGFHFTVLPDFEAVLTDLQKNPPYLITTDGVHGPPSYVHLDIDYMDDRFKLLFSAHMEKDISDYTADYYEQHFGLEEWERIGYWRKKLDMGSDNPNSID